MMTKPLVYAQPRLQDTQPGGSGAIGLPLIDVDGLPFVASTVDALSSAICDSASRAEGGWVVTPNIDILRRWRRDAAFRELVSSATVFTADGLPIVWASQLQGTPLPGRLTGSDLFVDLYRRATRKGLRVALIGGNPGAADEAVAVLAKQEPLFKHMAITHCPPFGFEQMPHEMRAITQLLDDWNPRVVFVGLGSPKQETLIRQLRAERPNAWYLGVGVSFSFVSGDVQRAPPWLQACGLEWLHRMVQEPGRLARRYLFHGVPFALELMWRSARRRRAA